MNHNLRNLLIKNSCINTQKLFHNSAIQFGNHYETLKLKRDCTTKDIKDSFIKLSKEHHPDLSKNPNSHKEFLKVQEAYSTLSKPESRANYDLGLTNRGFTRGVRNETRYTHMHYRPRYGQQGKNPWDDPFFYHNRDKSKDASKDGSYYGINDIRRQSKGTIAFLCVALAFLSGGIQMMIISYSFGKRNALLMKKSAEAEEYYREVRERAERNGHDRQVELLRQYFEERDGNKYK